MESRWKRKLLSRWSPDTDVSRWPSSEMNDIAFLLIGPKVSKASGMNMWVFSNSWYFNSFLSAAPSAAAPSVADDA